MSAHATRGSGGPAFLRFARDPAAGGADDRVRALEAEIVLLREENARLRVAVHRPASAGTLLELLADLDAGGGNADEGDDTARLVTELLVVRETLDVVCAEIEHSIGAVRGRLAGLAPDAGAGEEVPFRGGSPR